MNVDAARAPEHDDDLEPAGCEHCAELVAEVERLRAALVEIRRWTIDATHP